MKVVVTGGGSGGHITPIMAVAHELKQLQPDIEIIYIGEKGGHLSDVPAKDPNIDEVYSVWAGKLRRYADEGWRQWLNVRQQALNIRDAGRIVRGTWQSYRLLRKVKPNVVFTRGGFVSVPVAIAAWLNHVPYITHDSDSVPSLANRLIAPNASVHAVALPVDIYPYPPKKTVMVGVPVSKQYEAISPELQVKYRKELGLDKYAQVILLTGGGNGSKPLNDMLLSNAKYLLGTFPDLAIVHIAGRSLQDSVNKAYDNLKLGRARARVNVLGFTTELYRYSGSADVIVTRAGATTLAEFAIQKKACVVIPAPQLVGNHQVKNTQALAERGAVMQLTEDQAGQAERLGRVIGELLSDDRKRQKLAKKLAQYARPDAARELAELIIKVAGTDRDAR